MSLSFSSSVSSIQTALNVISVSAHNTANINTDGFKKQRTSLSESNTGGITLKREESTEPGPLYRHADGNMVEASNVDLSEEIIRQISAKHLFSANIVVFKTADKMEKGIIDIFA